MNEKLATQIGEAAREGNFKEFDQFFSNTDAERSRDLLDRTLVHAVFGRNVKIVDRLLKAGAHPEQTTTVGTLLMCAAMCGDLAIVKSLLSAGADMNREHRRETALSAALSENEVQVVAYLEKLRAHSRPSTTLLYASTHGDLQRAQRALSEGATTEETGGIHRETPLMAAVRKGKVGIVKLLLQHGANPNKRVNGRTALFDAVEFGQSLEVVDAMVAAGADIRAKNYDETVLMAAAKGGSLPIVKRLVELGADVQARDKNFGVTALDCAKQGKHKEVAAYLSGLGAASDRDAGRALVRALAKEFGGKPVEHSHGFMLNAKFEGTRCQFGVDTEGFNLFVQGLDFGEREFKRRKDAQLIFSRNKPDFQRQKIQRVKVAGADSHLLVFRTVGVNVLPVPFVVSFFRKHRVWFDQMKLSGQEVVRLGASLAAFSCRQQDIALVRPRLEAFGRLIREISRPPQPERHLFEGEWLMKIAPKFAAKSLDRAHAFGGQLNEPVGCPHCGCATNLMAQLDLSDRALPKTALGRGRLPVFWCLECLEWDAAFFNLSGSVPKPFNAAGRKTKPGRIKTGGENLAERWVTLIPVASRKKAGRKSKAGGQPAWIQMDETPGCPKCEKSMAFVLQLASDSRISYGDMGMLYAFACPECRVTASLIQSH